MPLDFPNLPPELLSEITSNVTSKEELCTLRLVNSQFDTLATPAAFGSITVRGTKQSAERFWTLLHTPHIARHVQSITFVEEHWKTVANDEVCKLLGAAFSVLHRTPGLKMLALHFDTHDIVACVDYYGDEAMRDAAYTHQWDIVNAIWSNKNPLPNLQSLEFHGWLFASKSASSFDEAPIASWLAPSLRHLSISVPQRGVEGTENWESRTLFWRQFVVPRVLQSAVNLESLTIIRDRARDSDTQDLGISQDGLPTYPRLAALSLRNIVWEEGAVGEGNVVAPPPLEDFIVRHRKTLKKLELRDCSIGIGIRSPLRCFWEDIFKRLAAALTELVELEVKFKFERYASLLAGRGFNDPSDHIFYIGMMADQDAPALEEFRAVVKNQGMGGGFELNDG